MKPFFQSCGLSIGLHLLCLITDPIATAQSVHPIEADGTTPSTGYHNCSSSCHIEGGQRRGDNLFHSFSRFNVERGATVLFKDPGVTNILTRVTGNESSQILGTLGVSEGQANLFLINPNGITFGPQARLAVDGSFVATTAHAVQFGDQGLLSASRSEVPLLTVNPSALIFNQAVNRPIVNRAVPSGVSNLFGIGLAVPDRRSLLLIGGDVHLEGGRVAALGGRVELGGVAGPGTVQIEVDGRNLHTSFQSQVPRANVSLSDGAVVNVLGNGGGDIVITAQDIDLSGPSSRIFAGVVGEQGNHAGNVILDATADITLAEGVRVFNVVIPGAMGQSGDIRITAKDLLLSGGSVIDASTFGQGSAGNILVNISGDLSLLVDSHLSSNVFSGAVGTGGNIRLTVNNLKLEDESSLDANTLATGQGEAGKIEIYAANNVSLDSESGIFSTLNEGATGAAGTIHIEAQNLSASEDSALSVNTLGSGNAGRIHLEVVDQTVLTVDSTITSIVREGAIGNAGDLELSTGSLFLSSGSQVSSGVFRANNDRPGGRGRGGNITIDASKSVTLTGFSEARGFPSGLFVPTEPSANGPAGRITVTTKAFQVKDGAAVNAQTFNVGQGGDITIIAETFAALGGGQIISTADNEGNAGNITLRIADQITLSGSDPTFEQRDQQFPVAVSNEGSASGLFASTRPGSIGRAGSIFATSPILVIRDGGRIVVNSDGSGSGGNVELRTNQTILDQQAMISANTNGLFGGNLQITAEDLLLLRNQSQISTDAGLDGQGGNIQITTAVVAAFPAENSDITANANNGPGGLINITTEGLLGLEVRDQLTTESDITAFSSNAPTLNGQVIINNPEVDPSNGLIKLTERISVPPQLAQRCRPGQSLGNGEFVNVGRGGLPPQPTHFQSATAVWQDLRQPSAYYPNPYPLPPRSRGQVHQDTPMFEAQGWLVQPDGRLQLIASLPQAPGVIAPARC